MLMQRKGNLIRDGKVNAPNMEPGRLTLDTKTTKCRRIKRQPAFLEECINVTAKKYAAVKASIIELPACQSVFQAVYSEGIYLHLNVCFALFLLDFFFQCQLNIKLLLRPIIIIIIN